MIVFLFNKYATGKLPKIKSVIITVITVYTNKKNHTMYVNNIV